MRHNTIKPISLDHSFWVRVEVLNALRNRDMGCLLRLVAVHSQASQTRIGTAIGLSQGQVSEVMNGTRQISSIDVLERVADGLAMPDDARMVLGLAPQYRKETEKSNPFRTYPVAINDAITSLEQLSAIDGSGRVEALNLTFRETGFVIASRDWMVARTATNRHPLLPKGVSSTDVTAIRDTFPRSKNSTLNMVVRTLMLLSCNTSGAKPSRCCGSDVSAIRCIGNYFAQWPSRCISPD